MILDEEKKFLVFWQKNREIRKKKSYMLLSGLPYGLLFTLPILINYLMGRYWYKRADAVGMSQSSTMILIIAVLIISVFTAFFYKQYQWEQNEQRFRELQIKLHNEENKNSAI